MTTYFRIENCLILQISEVFFFFFANCASKSLISLCLVIEMFSNWKNSFDKLKQGVFLCHSKDRNPMYPALSRHTDAFCGVPGWHMEFGSIRSRFAGGIQGWVRAVHGCTVCGQRGQQERQPAGKLCPRPGAQQKDDADHRTPRLTWCAANTKRASSITGFCTTPTFLRNSARMRVQFCRRSNPRASPFLCAPTMSTGMKPLRFLVRFCGATPPKIARKSPICWLLIDPAQHPQ